MESSSCKISPACTDWSITYPAGYSSFSTSSCSTRIPQLSTASFTVEASHAGVVLYLVLDDIVICKILSNHIVPGNDKNQHQDRNDDRSEISDRLKDDVPNHGGLSSPAFSSAITPLLSPFSVIFSSSGVTVMSIFVFCIFIVH